MGLQNQQAHIETSEVFIFIFSDWRMPILTSTIGCERSLLGASIHCQLSF